VNKLEVALSILISDTKIREGMFWADYLFLCPVSVLWTSSGPNICKRLVKDIYQIMFKCLKISAYDLCVYVFHLLKFIWTSQHRKPFK
jgi:hypothetical protein